MSDDPIERLELEELAARLTETAAEILDLGYELPPEVVEALDRLP